MSRTHHPRVRSSAATFASSSAPVVTPSSAAAGFASSSAIDNRDGSTSSLARIASASEGASSSSAAIVGSSSAPSSSSAAIVRSGASYSASNMSPGLYAATIVTPIVVFLALIGLGVWLLYRRRRNRSALAAANAMPHREPEDPFDNQPEMIVVTQNEEQKSAQELADSELVKRRSINSDQGLPSPRTLSGRSNGNSYLTGLDTSIRGSRPTSGDFGDQMNRRSVNGTLANPPPPYAPKTADRRSGAEADGKSQNPFANP